MKNVDEMTADEVVSELQKRNRSTRRIGAIKIFKGEVSRCLAPRK
jgi:hypothetical protein